MTNSLIPSLYTLHLAAPFRISTPILEQQPWKQTATTTMLTLAAGLVLPTLLAAASASTQLEEACTSCNGLVMAFMFGFGLEYLSWVMSAEACLIQRVGERLLRLLVAVDVILIRTSRITTSFSTLRLVVAGERMGLPGLLRKFGGHR